MTPRESDPSGAFAGGGAAGLEDEPEATGESRDAKVDEAERETITSGTAATSEVADRDAQDRAEGQGDGPPLPR